MNMNNKTVGLKYPTSGCASAEITNTHGLVISMPEGLPKLLEYLARETLRAQPDNVTEYIYTLVTQLLAQRDGADAENPAPASEQKQGQKSEDVPSADVEVEPEARVESAELSTASKIKLSSESVSQVKESKPPDESEEENSDSKEALAATKIQAGFRGYKTRKTLKLAAEAEKRTDEEIAAELKSPLSTIKEESFDLMNASAIKIQACFRGYLVRRDGRYMHLHSRETHPESIEAKTMEAADAVLELEAEELRMKSLQDEVLSEVQTTDLKSIVTSETMETEIVESEMQKIEAEIFTTAVKETEIPNAEVLEAEIVETDASEGEISKSEFAEAEILETKVTEAEIFEQKATEAEIFETKETEPEIFEIKATEVEILEAKPTEAEIIEKKLTQVEIFELKATEAEILETTLTEADIVASGATEVEIKDTKVVEVETLTFESEVTESGPTEAEIMESEPTNEKDPAEAESTKQRSLEAEIAYVEIENGDPFEVNTKIQESDILEESEPDTATPDDDVANTTNSNTLTFVQLKELEQQILPAEEFLPESATNQTISKSLDTDNSVDVNSISSEIQGQGNASPAISPEPPKTPEIEISEESLESSDLNEKVAELLVTLKQDEKKIEKIDEFSISMNQDGEIETSVDEPEENIPKTSLVEIECEKGTMTSEIPIMDAKTATEVIDDIVSVAENIVSTKSTSASPPNIIHESLAAVEVSESLVDSIIQEVGTTLLNKSDSDEIADIPSESPEPVVMRRKSKRDSALDKKTRSQYRSGVVGLEDTDHNFTKEPLQLPSVDEVEAIVEQEMFEHAATKIQAGFRGYKARKSINKASTAASKIQAGFRGFKARKTMANEKNAVIKIQATVRGFLARRRLAKAKQMRQRRRSSTSSLLNRRRKSSTTLNAAAVRIQAAYRGYRVRRISPLPPDDAEMNNAET